MKVIRVYLIILLVFSVSLANANHWEQLNRDKYLEKQLSCQIKVKELQWSYSIWPQQNKNSKPQFPVQAAVASIRENVKNTLAKEEILSKYSGLKITDNMLQSELDRIVRETKDPKRLQQYFQLLNNNADSIVECLVRPILVDKLWNTSEVPAAILSDWDSRSYLPETRKSDYFLPESGNPVKSNASTASSESDYWLNMNSVDAPVARYNHTAVWTGSKMIVWGGQSQINTTSVLQSGGLYDPVFDSWEATAITGSTPSARLGHTAIWTGTHMIIWGGFDGTNTANNGGRFDPVLNSWSDTGTSNLTSRQLHTAVWTGSRMIVWGGYGGGSLNSGGIYDPNLNTWSPTSTQSAPDGRYDFTAIWSGSKMVIWGGFNTSGSLATGGIYDMGSDSWAPTSTNNAPAARNRHTAIWTGQEMIIWSGSFLNNGGIFDVDSNTWRTMSETNAPTAGQWHSAVWTGSEMIIWGGYNYLNTGGRYVVDGSWTATGSNGSLPSGRNNHTAVWTGTNMIIWGGETQTGITKTGGIYFPDELIFANGYE